MRCFSNVVRPVLQRKAVVGFFAAFFSVALLPCGVALADTVSSDFESASGYHTGSVNGQNGWRSAPPGTISGCTQTNGQFDQAVASNGGKITGFGLQSLRMSNLCASGVFAGQTYSAPVNNPAGENQPNTVFIAKFSFYDPAYQPGLYVTISPDSGEGSRMAWVSLEDTSNGVLVTESDSSGPSGAFVDTDLKTLSHGAPHTIEFRIKLNRGPDNDQLRILIDGVDVGQCFTTWETYYRTAPEQAGPPNNGEPPTINSLQFRTSVQGPSELAMSGGYLFDNVTVTTGTGPSSPACDVTIDKKADSPTVTAGGLAGYRLIARNRGHLTARNLLLCDHIPRATTFVSADRKLRRIGRKRCLFIPSLRPGKSTSVHLTLRVNANAAPGNLDNPADITPVPPPGVPATPPAPPAPSVDLPSGAATAPVAPIGKAKAIVRILRARRTVQPPGPPRVTG